MFMLISLGLLMVAVLVFTIMSMNHFMDGNHKKALLCLAVTCVLLFAMFIIK